MNSIKDYRSDIVTLATMEMRQAMANADVGDDFSGEDPTVNHIEEMSAQMFGKEAGLFVISSTMANQIAIMTSTLHGDEVLVDEKSHIYNMETGGLAALSGVQARPLRSVEGQFDFDDVRQPSGVRDCNILQQGCDGTVVPEGQEQSSGSNHVNTWRIAYTIEGVRNWLFTQVKTPKS